MVLMFKGTPLAETAEIRAGEWMNKEAVLPKAL